MKNSVKICLLLCTLMSLLIFSSCGRNNAAKSVTTEAAVAIASTAEVTQKTEAEPTLTEAETTTEAAPETTLTEAETTLKETETETTTAVSVTGTETETITFTETTTVTETAVSVEKDGSYTTPEDVAEYIHTFGTLPKNFITKNEAKDLGWDSSKGNLWDVADGMSIGGDRFGNYEKQLPTAKGRKYTECDVNYDGGYRGSERIIFSNDGLIFYTNDHYKTFTQLY